MTVLEARGLRPGLAGEGRTCPLERGRGRVLGLGPGTPSVFSEPYVKVQLLRDRRKWKKRKTSARGGTASPYFNEAFTFPVPFSQIQVGCGEAEGGGGPSAGPTDQAFLSPCCPSEQSVDLVLAVWARGLQFRAEPVGKVLLGCCTSGQPLQHWADMLAHARRPVARWHRLRTAREVDGMLALRPRPRLPMPGS